MGSCCFCAWSLAARLPIRWRHRFRARDVPSIMVRQSFRLREYFFLLAGSKKQLQFKLWNSKVCDCSSVCKTSAVPDSSTCRIYQSLRLIIECVIKRRLERAGAQITTFYRRIGNHRLLYYQILVQTGYIQPSAHCIGQSAFNLFGQIGKVSQNNQEIKLQGTPF